MSDENHDPGDEHRDPWPFSVGKVFDVSASDDMAIGWLGKTGFRVEQHGGGWCTAVAEIDRMAGRTSIVYADGRVEDITDEAVEWKRMK
jgi:hypothetical protein